MKIKSTIGWGSKDYPVEYEDLDNFKKIGDFNQIYGFCFIDNKIAICYNKTLGFWVLPGGTPENEETIEQALKREIMEEAGLKLISFKPIGVQKVYGDKKNWIQLRAVCICKIVANHNDPTGDIADVKFINVNDFDKYINWGKVGSHMLNRAIILRNSL